MQRIGQTLARLGAARALLAGAILAVTAGPVGAQGEATEDTALAVPWVSAPDRIVPVALPRPLQPSEAERIRRIFTLQGKNDIPAAVAECTQLTDTSLLGDILADRYLGGIGRAKAADLKAWLAKYADLPDAVAIRNLLAVLSTKRNASSPPAPAPVVPALPPLMSGDEVEPVVRLMNRNPVLDPPCTRPRGRPEPRHPADCPHRGLDRIYGAQLRAEVAQILFAQGRDPEALKVAQAAYKQAQGQVGLAAYVAGLAAWRLQEPEVAMPLFEAAYNAPLIQPGQRAGAAFWAARAHLRSRDARDYAPWLRRASATPRTMYGLLARRALGQTLQPDPNWPEQRWARPMSTRSGRCPPGAGLSRCFRWGRTRGPGASCNVSGLRRGTCPGSRARSCSSRGRPV